jgi:predicted CopG family antitoxin
MPRESFISLSVNNTVYTRLEKIRDADDLSMSKVIETLLNHYEGNQ